MLGRAENNITTESKAIAYRRLGFVRDGTTYSPPALLHLPSLMETGRLRRLYDRARAESRRRIGRGISRGLTEYRVGVELTNRVPPFSLTEVRKGAPNHAGREVDRATTVIGTIHTHPWDVSQSIGDVRGLVHTNDLVGGVVTYTGRIFLLVKHPDSFGGADSPFAAELFLQGASLKATPRTLRQIGLLAALGASLDLPLHAARDPYIRALADRLGLLYYAGDVEGLTLRRR
jgi:hypothetical protein